MKLVEGEHPVLHLTRAEAMYVAGWAGCSLGQFLAVRNGEVCLLPTGSKLYVTRHGAVAHYSVRGYTGTDVRDIARKLES